MKSNKAVGDLTQAHLDQLSEQAAKAHLASAGIESRQKNALLRLKRTLAGMARRGIKESKKQNGGKGRNIYGVSDKQALAIKRRLVVIRREIEDANQSARWNNLDKSPTVLTNFCDRTSATKIDFGY